jgi:hypothetical protein
MAMQIDTKRICYFYNDEQVNFDASGSTIFVPLTNNYAPFDAIGVTLLPTGLFGSYVKHLVFYQATICDKHPVDSVAAKTIVNRWKEYAQEVSELLPCILVFISGNSRLCKEEQSYLVGGLEEQYVHRVSIAGYKPPSAAYIGADVGASILSIFTSVASALYRGTRILSSALGF